MRVLKTFLCGVTLTTIAFTSLSCVNGLSVEDENAAPIEMSLAEYFRNARKYDGEKVIVKGYLVSQGEVLHLDELAERPLKVNTPRMLIWDSTPSTQSGFHPIYQSRQCTDRYVKITGLLGQIPLVDIFGMTEIYEIRVFEDDTFRGEGELCYTKN